MKKVRAQLLTTAAMAVFTGGAYAADMGMPMKAPAPQPIPLPSWTGFYIGANVGSGRLNGTATGLHSDVSPCAYYGNSCSTSASGVVGGVEIGYDWQDRYFVYGVAADWTWTGLKHGRSTVSGSTVFTYQAKVDWLASFRGRTGLAVDNTLVYLTGGLALGQLKSNLNKVDSFGVKDSEALNTTAVGWVAGIGVEHKFTPNWSGTAEFRYYDLGRKTTNNFNSHTGDNYSTEFTHEIFTSTVGVRYRW